MENILLRARSIRRLLHISPELSGAEVHTSRLIRECMAAFEPDEIIEGIGGEGIAFIYKGKEAGKTILFRADMDAVPVEETTGLPYASRVRGVAHLCGHDGHVAMLTGFADLLHEQPLQKGKVILLFQPAEETGKGAKEIVENEHFKKLKPDYVFALHNLPGYPEGSIITRNEVFASASKGLIIKLKGTAAHAAYPEFGISPTGALAELITALPALSESGNYEGLVMVTIVHARLGEPAFGLAPSEAVLMATLRSFDKNDMDALTSRLLETTSSIAQKNQIKYSIEWSDEFIPTINNKEAVSFVEKAANDINARIIRPDLPFRWSEDFGQFTSVYKGAMFGLGAGEECKPLHNSGYDFPDEILETGIRMFYHIVDQIINGKYN